MKVLILFFILLILLNLVYRTISLLFQTQWIFLLLTKNLDKEFITMKENFIKILSLFGIILINII